MERLKEFMIPKLYKNETKSQNREFRIAVYLGEQRAITRTIFGHKIIVDTRDTIISPHLLLDGYWEIWVTRCIEKLVKEGQTVVEVGSNVGYYSLILASKIGPNGKLYCFEANPYIAEILKDNLEINGYKDRTVVIPKPVYSTKTKMKFYISKRASLSNLFGLGEEDFSEEIEVETVTLDEFFPPKTHIDLIKTDAEGSDFHVLKGAERILTENQDIIVIQEFIPTRIEGSGLDPKDCLKWIQKLGFKIFRIDEHKGYLEKIQEFDQLIQRSYSDLLYIRNPSILNSIGLQLSY